MAKKWYLNMLEKSFNIQIDSFSFITIGVGKNYIDEKIANKLPKSYLKEINDKPLKQNNNNKKLTQYNTMRKDKLLDCVINEFGYQHIDNESNYKRKDLLNIIKKELEGEE